VGSASRTTVEPRVEPHKINGRKRPSEGCFLILDPLRELPCGSFEAALAPAKQNRTKAVLSQITEFRQELSRMSPVPIAIEQERINDRDCRTLRTPNACSSGRGTPGG
jgi:hypothetical protein